MITSSTHPWGGASFYVNCSPRTCTSGMGDREQTDEAECLEGDKTPLTTSTSSESPSKAAGYWWHVNKSGFPISEETWSKMWQHIADVHPDAAQISSSIRGQTSLKGVPPIPPCPSINPAHSVHHNLLLVQNYMNELQYNHTGTQFFDIKKSRPLSRQVRWIDVCTRN